MSNHRGKWVHNTLGVSPLLYFERFVYFLLENILQVSRNSSPNRHTQKWLKMFTEYQFYFWLKKSAFLTWSFLPSPQQYKFTLPCGLSSTWSKSWKSFNNRSGFITYLSNMITDTRSVLSQVNGGCHWAFKKKKKKGLLPFPQAQRVKKWKHRSQINGPPHPTPRNFRCFFLRKKKKNPPLMFQNFCLKIFINL